MRKRKKKVEQRYRWDKHRWSNDVCVRCGVERRKIGKKEVHYSPIRFDVFLFRKKGSDEWDRLTFGCEIEKPTRLYGYPNKKAKEMIKYFCEVGKTTYFDMPYEYRGMYGRMWECGMLVEVDGGIKPTELMHEMNRKYNQLK